MNDKWLLKKKLYTDVKIIEFLIPYLKMNPTLFNWSNMQNVFCYKNGRAVPNV